MRWLVHVAKKYPRQENFRISSPMVGWVFTWLEYQSSLVEHVVLCPDSVMSSAWKMSDALHHRSSMTIVEYHSQIPYPRVKEQLLIVIIDILSRTLRFTVSVALEAVEREYASRGGCRQRPKSRRVPNFNKSPPNRGNLPNIFSCSLLRLCLDRLLKRFDKREWAYRTFVYPKVDYCNGVVVVCFCRDEAWSFAP